MHKFGCGTTCQSPCVKPCVDCLFGFPAWTWRDHQIIRPKSSSTDIRAQNNGELSFRDQTTELFVATKWTQKPDSVLALPGPLALFLPAFASHQKLCTIHLHLLLSTTQPSAATTPAPPCSPWPQGTSCSSQAAGRVGSASWSCRTSCSARASRPTTLRSKPWLWTRRRTASSVAHRRETSGWLWATRLSVRPAVCRLYCLPLKFA